MRFLLFLVGLFCTTNLFSQTLEQKLLANYGSADSQYEVGKGYLCSRKDTSEAIVWFVKAAKQGNVDAMTQLSYILDKQKNYYNARYWLEKSVSIKTDDGNSLKLLGDYFYEGKGGKQDKSKAATLYSKAVSLGNNSACEKLGIMLYLGDGVEVNYIEAVQLFEKGNYKTRLSRAYYEGKGVRQDFVKAFSYAVPFLIAKDLKDPMEFDLPWEILYDGCEKQARKGNAEAMFLLYSKSDNLVGQEKWLKKAAQLGHVEAKKVIAKEIYLQSQKWHDGLHSYMQIRKLLQEAADLGYAPAQNALGVSFQYGTSGGANQKRKGVDYEKAISWLKKAASQDFAPAICNLAVMYEKGYGTPKDEAKSIELLKKAANMGNTRSMNLLSRSYALGIGVEKNMDIAIKWLISFYAIEKRFQPSWFECNEYIPTTLFFPLEYSRTESKKQILEEFKTHLNSYIPQDDKESCAIGYIISDFTSQKRNLKYAFYVDGIFEQKDALHYLEKGIHTEKEANLQIGDFYEQQKLYSDAMEYYTKVYNLWDINYEWRYFIDKIMTAADANNKEAQCAVGIADLTIKTAHKEAVDYLLKAAIQGHAKAQNLLGICYFNGYGTEQNLPKAFEWFSKSAENNFAKGQFNIGNCFYNGWGVKADYKKAFEWFQKSAKQGNVSAMIGLATCYLEGRGVKKDTQQALKLLHEAENTDDTANHYLGLCYLEGIDGTPNYDKAISYFLKSKNRYALVYLGKAYLENSNYSEAIRCFRMGAKDYGLSIANGYIGMCYYYGYGTEKNFDIAFKLLENSVNNGTNDSTIFHLLSNCYRNGYGVTANIHQADLFLNKAMSEDNKLAEKITSILQETFIK